MGIEDFVTSERLAKRVVAAFDDGEIHEMLPSFPVAHARFDNEPHFYWTDWFAVN